ncbi:DUF2314 domain-containing protein [Micromonospora sp. NPDC049559]|uniref:DUF2314 domain-containing protein n=1 Tax=Micromonospora sp. NPDC049559 TaxID=3155923 RepID=UPI00341AAC18
MVMIDDFLPVPAPETLSATYLVPTSARHVPSPAEAVSMLAGRLAGPAYDLTRELLDSPLMTVGTRPVGEFPKLPPDLLTAFGATERQLDRLAAATELILVQASYRPGWPPAHEWAARALAAALAEAVGGDLVDVFGLQFLEPARALRSLPGTDGRIRLVDWVLVPYSSDGDGLWFTTKGLRRFGLLELQARGVPAHLTRSFGAVMAGAARRLLRRWIDGLAGPEPPAFVPLPTLVPVSGRDIAAAYGNPAPGDPDAGSRRRGPGDDPGLRRPLGSTLLRLELDPATDPEADSFLSLLPPEGHPGPPGRYYAALCATLFGGDPADPRYARPDDAMARAIATARDGLPDVRERFLAGGLPAGTQLVVKYALPSADGPEFVWAGVTSWASPDRIHGASASDAATDPAVRIGQPVEVATADVVDWALLDETGVLEGGWTQAVLDAGERS